MKKLLLWLTGLLIIIGGLLIFLTARYADRLADPFVRSLLEQNKPLHHKIEYKRIRVNLIKKQIQVRDVKVYPEPGFVKDEHFWAEAGIGLIRLTDFSLREMILNKSLVIKDLIFLDPEVTIHMPVTVTAKAMDKMSAQEDSVIQDKAMLLTQISLDRMLLSGGKFKLVRNDVELASSDEISFLARDIRLVKNSRQEPVGYEYGDVTMALSNIRLHSETGLYNLSLGKLSFTKEDSSLVLTGFRMEPKYDRQEFSKRLKTQNDQFDVEIGTLELAGIGYRRAIDGLPLEISRVTLDSVHAEIFRDKNVSFDFNRFPVFYNESFLKLQFPVVIDTMEIIRSLINYSELAEGRAEPGQIRLEDFSLKSYGLKNKPEDDTIADAMIFDIRAKIMGEGAMTAEVVLPLEGDLRAIACSGSIGAMQLSPLNAMLEPSMNMKFNGGKVTRMTFSFTGNNEQSEGWMEFLYTDLDVVLLDKDQAKEKGFLSFLANTMTNSNNPEPGSKHIKSVIIGFERDKNKGLINYVWKTLQSGMVRTILPVGKYNINNQEKVRKQQRKHVKASS